MASAQATFEFPLLSLPLKHQLLVISLKNNKTLKEEIELLTLCPEKNVQIKDNITIPKIKAIKAIYPNTNALAEFNRIFNDATERKYYNFLLRKKIVEAFDRSGIIFTTQKGIINYLSWQTKESSIHLLNVQDFATQFTNLSIPAGAMKKMQSESSIKALFKASEILCDIFLSTNVAVYDLLDQAENNKASNLYLVINDLKLKCDVENTTRKHTLHLFKASLDAPNQLPILKNLILQLFKDLDTIEKNKLDLSSYDQYRFIARGFLPSFDSQQETISSAVKDRILTMNAYRTEIKFLRGFSNTLMTKFESQIYIPSSEEKDAAIVAIKEPTENTSPGII